MSSHRTWDESQSPQWRFLLEKESVSRKNRRKTSSRIRREELEKTVVELSLESKKTKKEKWNLVNSELKKEANKKQNQANENTQRTTRLSTEPKEQE